MVIVHEEGRGMRLLTYTSPKRDDPQEFLRIERALFAIALNDLLEVCS
jgi:hypothetical protein